ncbi:unnamed protein product, partial [Ectocarpus sp. 8 AP-2014]
FSPRALSRARHHTISTQSLWASDAYWWWKAEWFLVFVVGVGAPVCLLGDMRQSRQSVGTESRYYHRSCPINPIRLVNELLLSSGVSKAIYTTKTMSRLSFHTQ